MNDKVATDFIRSPEEDEHYALHAATFRRDHAQARTRRLIAAAFENEERASKAVTDLLARGGWERVEAALRSEFQHVHFGFQKKAFLGFFASRQPDVRRAIQELPLAVRELEETSDLLRDLSAAFRERRMREGAARACTPLHQSHTEPRIMRRGRARTPHS